MELFFSSRLLFGEGVLNQLHVWGGRFLDLFMIAITSLGDENFYIVFIPLIYWCLDKTLATRIGGAFLVSTIVNDTAKGIFGNPRPVAERLVEGIRELNTEYMPKNSPGFPSGHAQSAVVFWGALAFYAGRRRLYAPALILILLIAYSRLYLAVHFLGDVLGGLIIGIIFLALYIIILAWIEKKYALVNRSLVVAAALVIPYLLFKILPGNDLGKTAGVLSGFIVGIILEREKLDFVSRSGFAAQLVKIVIGFAGVILIKAGLKPLLPTAQSSDFLRYWLMGMWITFLAPYIFERIPLTRRASDS